MVDHDQKGIKTIRKGKVGDQIAGDLLKGAGAGGWNGEKWGSRQVGIGFVLLAQGTSTDITADVRGETWLPKLRGNKLASFENTRMTSSGVVMVSSNNRVAQVSICRDIDLALVSQDASVIVPVGEAGMESSGNCARESMESVKDQWVQSRGRVKFISEGGVY